ncbi:MAG: pirin family protein, partial [Chloroflexota bacterium]
MLYKQSSTPHVKEQDSFTIRRFFPGRAIPDHKDHGYGPLVAIDDATLNPGTVVKMHEHRNDEIVTYVHQGVMHHSDYSGATLDIDRHNLMVMNAGRSFWHQEQVY